MTTHTKIEEMGQESAMSSSDEATRSLETKPVKAYVSPAILSHSGADILEELGPAQACYPFSSCGVSP